MYLTWTNQEIFKILLYCMYCIRCFCLDKLFLETNNVINITLRFIIRTIQSIDEQNQNATFYSWNETRKLRVLSLINEIRTLCFIDERNHNAHLLILINEIRRFHFIYKRNWNAPLYIWSKSEHSVLLKPQAISGT